jgi:bifunctional DNA-binding transcriptional regulator/antitoxin component of YhaV-PrlF toxin-antitoxin module
MFPAMERLINRRQQGDLGEASAIEWFTRAGAVVSTPLGHSPDYDLIVDFGADPLRVQAKTSTQIAVTPNGRERYQVMLATNGGNQSWNHATKVFGPDRSDLVFVIVANGRRWLIPSAAIDAERQIQLGGPRYSEYEIGAAEEIYGVVYGLENSPFKLLTKPGERRSWRAERDCKFRALALSEFESHLPHSSGSAAGAEPPRRARTEGQTRVSGNRQIVIPKRAFENAALDIGDRLNATSVARGQVTFCRIDSEAQNENGPPGGGPFQQSLEAGG